MKTEGSPGEGGVWEPRRRMEWSATCHAAGGQEGGNGKVLVFTIWRSKGAPVRDMNL